MFTKTTKVDSCQNKGQTFSVCTPVFVRNYKSGQPNWPPGTIHKRKGQFVYNIQVGKQFWAQHKNQLHPRYAKNNIIANTPTIPLDMQIDTFDLPSL